MQVKQELLNLNTPYQELAMSETPRYFACKLATNEYRFTQAYDDEPEPSAVAVYLPKSMKPKVLFYSDFKTADEVYYHFKTNRPECMVEMPVVFRVTEQEYKTRTINTPSKETTMSSKKETKPASTKAPKVAKAATETVGEYGVERSHDLPWCAKKVAVFKALKAVRALTANSSASSKHIAEKAKVTPREVRHYCYHAKASGLVGVATNEEFAGYGFYLTKKGQNVDPVKAFKEQEKAK